MADDEIDENRGSDTYAGQCAGFGCNMTNASQSLDNSNLCKNCDSNDD